MEEVVVWTDPMRVASVLLNEMKEGQNVDELKKVVVSRSFDPKLLGEVRRLVKASLLVAAQDYCATMPNLSEEALLAEIRAVAAKKELPDSSSKKTLVAFVTGKTGAPAKKTTVALELIGDLASTVLLANRAGYSTDDLVVAAANTLVE